MPASGAGRAQDVDQTLEDLGFGIRDSGGDVRAHPRNVRGRSTDPRMLNEQGPSVSSLFHLCHLCFPFRNGRTQMTQMKTTG